MAARLGGKRLQRVDRQHESILTKSLLCAGTTWAGVWLSEDQRPSTCSVPGLKSIRRVGCGGLSGGGLRTCYLAGLDDRIACAVPVGMMTTWRDYLLNKSYVHTWMIYIPHCRDSTTQKSLGCVCRPVLVLNDTEDRLFTLSEMRRADAMLRTIYDSAGGSDHYRCSYYPGPHKFDLAMQAEAFAWFDRWLGTAPAPALKSTPADTR